MPRGIVQTHVFLILLYKHFREFYSKFHYGIDIHLATNKVYKSILYYPGACIRPIFAVVQPRFQIIREVFNQHWKDDGTFHCQPSNKIKRYEFICSAQFLIFSFIIKLNYTN